MQRHERKRSTQQEGEIRTRYKAKARESLRNHVSELTWWGASNPSCFHEPTCQETAEVWKFGHGLKTIISGVVRSPAKNRQTNQNTRRALLRRTRAALSQHCIGLSGSNVGDSNSVKLLMNHTAVQERVSRSTLHALGVSNPFQDDQNTANTSKTIYCTRRLVYTTDMTSMGRPSKMVYGKELSWLLLMYLHHHDRKDEVQKQRS